MTREEAIKLLEHISIAYTPTDAYGDYDDPEPYEQAIDMAIEALQAELTATNTEKSSNCGDLISRADAIERFCKFGTLLERQNKTMITMVDAKYAFIETLESLPSAEAPYMFSKAYVEQLRFERDYLQEVINELTSAEAEPMTEEVREALMRLTMCAREECGMCKYKDECGFDFQYKISTDNMNTLSDALMRSRCEVDAKSADRPSGEWKVDEKHTDEVYTHPVICSVCGQDVVIEWGEFTPFCPNCGAKMRNNK